MCQPKAHDTKSFKWCSSEMWPSLFVFWWKCTSCKFELKKSHPGESVFLKVCVCACMCVCVCVHPAVFRLYSLLATWMKSSSESEPADVTDAENLKGISQKWMNHGPRGSLDWDAKRRIWITLCILFIEKGFKYSFKFVFCCMYTIHRMLIKWWCSSREHPAPLWSAGFGGLQIKHQRESSASEVCQRFKKKMFF